MSYNQKLADRIEALLKNKRGISRKKIFGGLCFLLHGNMLCGIVDNKIVARVGPEAYESSLKLKHTQPMDFTGKPLKGMVYVTKDGIKTKVQLNRWLERCLKFVTALPKK